MTRRAGGRQQIPRPDEWRSGGPPPWPVPSPALDAARALDRLHDLFDREPAGAPEGEGSPSAVLVLLADGPDGAELLLTRRPWHIRTHKGEVSFPGGRLDRGETFERAALREAHEEVGLTPDEVQLVGRLPPIRLAVSDTWVVPVIARIAQPLELVGHDAEVDRVFWVPLHDFTVPGTFHEEHWTRFDMPGGTLRNISILFFDLDDETVWGLTARVIAAMLEALYTPGGRGLRLFSA